MSTRGFETWTQADVETWNAQRRAKGVMPSEPGQSSSGISSAEGGVTHPPKSTSKYRNRATFVGDVRFDSKHEAECFLTLQAMQTAGVIHDLQRQVSFELCCPIEGTHLATAVRQYRADFTWRDRDEVLHVGDAKSAGTRTAMYLLKAEWLNKQKGLRIEEL